MAINMEKKMVNEKIRDMPREDYAMIGPQKMTGVNDGANALQLMLDGKPGILPRMRHHGVRVGSTQVGYAAKDAWRSPRPSWLPTARRRCSKTF